MDAAATLLAVAALGIQWGYQPASDGTIEYTIQLSPLEARHLLESPGIEFTSDVPDEAQPVGRIRIMVGEGSLPQQPLATGQHPQAGVARGVFDPAVQPASAKDGTQLAETQLRVVGEPARFPDQDLAGRLVEVPPWPDERQGLSFPVHTVDAPEDSQPGAPPSTLAEAEQSPPRDVPQIEETSPSDLAAPRPPDPASPIEPAPDRPWLPLITAIALACGFLAGNVFQWRSYMSLRKRYLHLLRKTGG